MSITTVPARSDGSNRDGVLVRAVGQGSYGMEQTVLVTSRADCTARWISVAFSPPLCLLALTLLSSLSIQAGRVWVWVLSHALFAILLPLLYLVRLYRSGAVSDLELNRRRERIRPLGATLAGTLFSLLALQWGEAPPALVLVAGLSALQTGVFLLITLWWKISAHALTATGLAVMGFFTIGLAAMPAVFLAVLVAWSRVQLGAHTLSQTVAGASLGGGLWAVGLLTF